MVQELEKREKKFSQIALSLILGWIKSTKSDKIKSFHFSVGIFGIHHNCNRLSWFASIEQLVILSYALLTAFIFLLIVGLSMIISQTYNASTENPVKNLRSE